MTTATSKKTKRKAAGRKRAAPKKRVPKTSWLDHLLRALPFSQSEIQRGFTWILVMILIIISFGVARYMGWPEQAYQKYAALSAQAGFEVKRVEITGMDRVDQLKVYDIVLAEKDRAMPLVNVDQIRADLVQYGWVKDVRVSRRLPDMLVVDIIERKPSAIWKHDGKSSLIDDEGVILEDIADGAGGDLPFIKGAGANEQAVALTKLIDFAPSLKPHIIGSSWIGNRRWDLMFKTGETLSLPEGEKEAAAALRNFARLEGVHRLLGGEIIHFDMRDPERAYLRRGPKSEPEPIIGRELPLSANGGETA